MAGNRQLLGGLGKGRGGLNAPMKGKGGNRRSQIKKNLGGGSYLPQSLSEPLTYKQALNIANQMARNEAAPTINAIKGQISGSVQRQKNIGEWFQGLQNTIDQSAAATDQSYAAANNSLLAHANAGAEAAAKSQGAVQANNNQMLALTGADPSLTAPIEAEASGAANQRQIANAALAAPIAQAGASQAAYLRNTGINSQREGIQQKLLEAKRRDVMKQNLGEARAARARQAVTNLFGPNMLRNNERDYKIQQDAFGLKGQEFQQGVKQTNYENKVNAAKEAYERKQDGQELSVRQQELALEWERFLHPNKSGGGGNGDQRENKQARQNAMAAANALYLSDDPPVGAQEWARFQTYLQEQGDVSPNLAAWAVQQLKQRYGSGAVNAGKDVNGPSLGR